MKLIQVSLIKAFTRLCEKHLNFDLVSGEINLSFKTDKDLFIDLSSWSSIFLSLL